MRVRIAAALLLVAGVALSGCETVHSVFHGGTPSNFIVFFPVGGADLSPDAKTIVRDAATAIKHEHPQTVVIAAGAKAGMELSQPRFAAVRQALIDDGVDQDLIARSALADPKLDETPARQRVEIRLQMKGP
jgi:outer membrane protein OmpA-like peptidoglycan-associated protein